MEIFSKRNNFVQYASEITIHDSAPPIVREAVISIALNDAIGLRPSQLRNIACQELNKTKNVYNFSEYPNIYGEVKDLIDNCMWHKIYDIIEKNYAYLTDQGQEDRAYVFQEKINEHFCENGVGWQLDNGLLKIRGSKVFEYIIDHAAKELSSNNMNNANSEFTEAVKDLSKRPVPGISGAINHAMAAVECVAREISGKPNDTLGKIINDRRDLFPKPLDIALEKLWGFASEYTRHVREGRKADFAEAELVVSLSGTICTYLLTKTQQT